jgi:hypothetical protein
MLEALEETANPIDWQKLRSQSGLRWFGLGPTEESDQLYYPSMESDPWRAQPNSVLPGRVTYVSDVVRGKPRGVRQDLEALRRAARPLRRALIAEALHATGIPFGKNERVNILSGLWYGFILNFETSSVEDTRGRGFDGVRVTHAVHAAMAAAEVPPEISLPAATPTTTESPETTERKLPTKREDKVHAEKMSIMREAIEEGYRPRQSKHRNISLVDFTMLMESWYLQRQAEGNQNKLAELDGCALLPARRAPVKRDDPRPYFSKETIRKNLEELAKDPVYEPKLDSAGRDDLEKCFPSQARRASSGKGTPPR